MRVLLISHLFVTPADPSCGIFVLEQIRALRKLGVETTVISPRPFAPRWLSFWNRVRKHRNTPHRAVIDGFSVEYPRMIELPGARLLYLYGFIYYLQCRKIVRMLMSRERYDILHAHMAIPDGFAAILLGKEFNLPVVCTAHGEDINDFPDRNRFLRKLTAWVLRRAGAIIAVSEDIRRNMLRLGVTRHVEIVRNGADGDRFKPMGKQLARQRLGLPQEAKIVLFVGYLVFEKALDQLLQAFASLSHRDAVLYIVGSGPLQQSLQELAIHLDLSTRCVFAGWQPHYRIADWLSAADCLVLSSITEGLPTILPEAMMCRVPIVSTAVGGVPEVVKSGATGFLVPPGDREALAKGIADVLHSGGQIDALIQSAESYARANLTWSANAHKMKRTYSQLLGKTQTAVA